MTGKNYFLQREHIAGSGIVFNEDDIEKIIENEEGKNGGLEWELDGEKVCVGYRLKN